MKILWVTNIAPNQIIKKIGTLNSRSGTWIESSYESLIDSNIDVSILSFSSKVKGQALIETNSNPHWLLEVKRLENPTLREKRNFESLLMKILKTTNPQIVHLWGTEYIFTSLSVKCCEGKVPVVVELQGLNDPIYKSYGKYLPLHVFLGFSPIHYLRHKTILQEKIRFLKYSKIEQSVINSIKYVIGRTDFDRDFVKSINYNIQYFHCSHRLRSNFYNAKQWNFDTAEKNTIFFGSYVQPIKGFYLLLKALVQIKKVIPSISVYVIGSNPFDEKGILSFIKTTPYIKYLKRTIIKFNLLESVKFTGYLSAVELEEYLRKVSLFVSTSLMENSPNMISEAMMIGTPVIAYNTGGIQSIMKNYSKGYLVNEVNHLEGSIIATLNRIELLQNQSKFACFDNYKQSIIEIYSKILDCENIVK